MPARFTLIDNRKLDADGEIATKARGLVDALRTYGFLACEDEPTFVLRAQDETAALAVADWADRAERRGVSTAIVGEARAIAAHMASWPTRKLPD